MFYPPHGEAGHIPELFSPTISLIHWLARGRKDKSTAFDGSPFNGGAGGERPEGNLGGAFWKRDASVAHKMNQRPDGRMNASC